MKYFFFFLLLGVAFSSCKSYEEPIYIGIENLTMLDIDNDNIVIGANVKFRNPNELGGDVINTSINVLYNQKIVAKLKASESFKIPAKNQFSIPMEATIPSDALKDKTNILGGITGLLINKKIDFTFRGDLILDLKVMQYTYDINETKSVALGKKRK